MLLLYLPCTFCLGFFLIYIMRKDYSLPHRLVTIIAALLTILFFANSLYFSNFEDYKTLAWSQLIKHITTPLLPFAVLIYLHILANKKIKLWQTVAYITFPVLVGTACTTIYLTIGLDNIALYLEDIEKAGHILPVYQSNVLYQAYEIVCCTAYDLILWLECIYLFLYALHFLYISGCRWSSIVNFISNKGYLTPLQLQSIFVFPVFLLCMARTFYTRWFLLEHPYISDIVSIFAAMICICFCLVGLYSQLEKLSIWFFIAPIRGNFIYTTEHQLNRNDELHERFKSLFEEQKPYLQFSLKLEDLAAMLQTNRQYLSHLINTEYKQTFPDYINSLRIKSAQEYMLQHPHATQDEIARNSGFNSAQTFNRRFKLEAGMTPAEWLASRN